MTEELPHIRCIGCGKPIAVKWKRFKSLLASGVTPEQALNNVGLTRYCCRMWMLSPFKVPSHVERPIDPRDTLLLDQASSATVTSGPQSTLAPLQAMSTAGTVPPSQTARGTIPMIQTAPSQTAPSQTAPGAFPPSQTTRGTIPMIQTTPGAFPPSQTARGTIPMIQIQPGTFPPSQSASGTIQFQPGTIPTSQFPQLPTTGRSIIQPEDRWTVGLPPVPQVILEGIPTLTEEFTTEPRVITRYDAR